MSHVPCLYCAHMDVPPLFKYINRSYPSFLTISDFRCPILLFLLWNSKSKMKSKMAFKNDFNVTT